MQSVTDKILDEVEKYEDGWCFFQKDFMELASRDALDQAFSRLVRSGQLRRVGRGIYDIPRYSELLKTTLSPVPDQIAKAVARKHGWRIQPAEAAAANLLNLSTQVPMKMVYLSDGPSKNMKFGPRTLYFKKTAPKNLSSNELSGLVINALKYFGKDRITPEVIAKLRDRLDETHKKQLLEDVRFGMDWIVESVHKICGGMNSNE